MVICGQEFSATIIDRIKETINIEPLLSRRSFSRRICEWLNWKRDNGKPKDMSCRVALKKMHTRGIITLPAPKYQHSFKPVKDSLPVEVDVVSNLKCSLQGLENIEVVKVTRYSKTSHIWTALMRKYHYLGAGPLCGAQMRYLFKSSRYGWLGGFSFSAAAWRLSVRDSWIGWNDSARKHNLHRIVANSRFLILPQVQVPNLASHVLSRCVARVKEDWLEAYGIEPMLLETFVEQGRFKGTCYQAANWKLVGATCGRGRQDRRNTASVPVKDVYVYPLRTDALEILCGEPVECISTNFFSPALPVQDWVEAEFCRTDYGDNRLNKRLLDITRSFFARPQASVPQACVTRAKTKAAYRFFDHKDTTMDKTLASHYETTLSRVSKEKVVLSVQDTTSLNYNAHPATGGLGSIGSYSATGLMGLQVHDTMAFNLEGTPLGLLDVQCWARDPEDFGKAKRRHELPIEQKESYKWLKSFQKTTEARKRCPDTMLVSIGDREADIYELFSLAKTAATRVELLVRSKENRRLANEQGRLWEKVSAAPVSGVQEIYIPRQGNRKSRTARLDVRFAEVTLKPPKRKVALDNLTVWAVYAKEADAPEGVKPLEWMLLTTIKVSTFEQAIEKLQWYTLRWGIEVYHRTLKSGCKIEERQLGHADRIETCLAIDMVVAWRIYHLTKLGREIPDMPCTVFFADEEWKALVAYKTQNPVPPEKPPTLQEATHMVASLGGFLGRKGDGQPGTKSLWLGLQRLDDISATWKFMAVNYAPHLLNPTVSSDPGYG